MCAAGGVRPRWLEGRWKKRKKSLYPSKWREILAEKDTDLTRFASEVAREAGCSPGAVEYWRHARVAIAEMEEAERKRKANEPVHCTRCGFLGEEQNPIGQSGLCLYCRLIMRGVNLLHWYESGAAEEYLRRYRDGHGNECGKRDGQVGGDEASGVCV